MNRSPTQRFRGSVVVVAAWLWLAADTDDVEEKRRCLKAVLEVAPDNSEALLALAALRLGKADQ